MKKLTLLAVLCSAILFNGCSEDRSCDCTGPGNDSPPNTIAKLALIYAGDPAWANDFAGFLGGKGFPTTLVNTEDVVSTDFAAYAMIIGDARIGSGFEWGDDNAVAKIDASGKPVLGLGYGGARLLGELGSHIDWKETRVYTDTTDSGATTCAIWPENKDHAIFNTPHQIDITSDTVTFLYFRSGLVGRYRWNLPDSIRFFGRVPNEGGYYAIVSEGDRYCLWGFANAPSLMTEAGRALFINLIYWHAGIEVSP